MKPFRKTFAYYLAEKPTRAVPSEKAHYRALLEEFTSSHYLRHPLPARRSPSHPPPPPTGRIAPEYAGFFEALGQKGPDAPPVLQGMAGERLPGFPGAPIPSWDKAPAGYRGDRHHLAYMVLPSVKGNLIETIVSIRCQKTAHHIHAIIFIDSPTDCKRIKSAYNRSIRVMHHPDTAIENPDFKDNGAFEIVVFLVAEAGRNTARLINTGFREAYAAHAKYAVVMESGDTLSHHHAATLTTRMDRDKACVASPRRLDAPEEEQGPMPLKHGEEPAQGTRHPPPSPPACVAFHMDEVAALHGDSYLCNVFLGPPHVLPDLMRRLVDRAHAQDAARQAITCIPARTVIARKTQYSPEALAELKLDPRRTNVLILGYSDDASKGGAITVTNNLAMGLLNETTDVYMLINSFDDTGIEFYKGQKNGTRFRFRDRGELLKALSHVSPANLALFDIIHVNCWHFANDFIPFHKKRDALGIEDFFNAFPMAHLVYTDHSDYSKDKRIINAGLQEELAGHGVTDFEALAPEQQEQFIQAYKLDRHGKTTLTDGGYYWTTEMNDRFWARWTLMNFSCKRELMKLADKTVYVSKSQRDTIPRLCPNIVYGQRPLLPGGTLPDVIYNGVDIDRFENDSGLDELVYHLRNARGKEIAIPRTGKVVLYLGRLDPHKGILHFARAIPRISRSHPDATFLFVGGHAPGFDKEIVAASGQCPKVIVAGRVPGQRNAAAIYKRSDLTVQPTLGESFNQVAMESLFMGTPVAISDIDGPGEVYIQNGLAFGLKPGDTADIADKITDILSNLARAREQVRQNRQRIIRAFHAETMCRNYFHLYTTLMERRSHAPN